jgi:hypothetical protein
MEHRSNSDLLDDLRAEVKDSPRRRLHVHPDSAVWIMIGVQNTGLSHHVQVVADPECREVGKGWIEALTVERWRDMRALAGRQVTVKTCELGALTGTLLALDHGEARLDLGDGDIRYLPWIEVYEDRQANPA